MSIKDYSKVALKNLIRIKKNIFYIIIIVICAILALVALTFSSNFSSYIKTAITKNPSFRTLLIWPNYDLKDYGENKLSTIGHVNEVYSSKYAAFMVETNLSNDNLNGKVELLYGAIKALPNVIVGRTFKDGDRNVAICPINFYPDSLESGTKINEKYMIDGNKSLGKTFTAKYYKLKVLENEVKPVKEEKYTKTFEIVGFYDNEKVLNFNNACYIPALDHMEMVNAKSDLPPEIAKDYVSGFYVVVDDLSNVETVIAKAKGLGFKDIETSANIDANLVRIIQISNIAILTIVLFTTIMLTSSYLKKKLLNETKIIGILRTCGYTRKNVKNVYLLETLFINIATFIIGLLLFLMIYFILLNTVFYSFAYVGIKISLNLFSIIFAFIIIVLIPSFITSHHITKKVRLDIVNLISNEE